MKNSLITLGVIILSVTLIVFPIACGGGGDGGGGEDTGGGESTDTTAPTAPTGLSATAVDEGQIDLNWTASTDNVGVTGYEIFRDGAGLALTTETSYNDTGFTPAANTTYCYTVKASDAANNVSDASNEACATTIDTNAPTLPTDFVATAVSNSQIDLSWTASTDNVGVDGYKIYRDTIEIDSTAETSYSDTGLDFDTHYCYTVKAYDAAGNVSDDSIEECPKTNVGFDGIKWKYDTGNVIYYSSPAIASDGTIYVGDVSSGTIAMGLYAINADGTLKWKYEISNPVFTPAVGSDGTIYVQDNTATLYAVAEDGTEKWSYPLSASHEVGQSAPALGLDGTIYVGADGIYAINPDGTLKWSYFPAGFDTISIIHSSPAVASDGTILVGANGNFGEFSDPGRAALFAINPDGTLKWRYILEGADFVFSSPAIDSEGTIYIGGETSTGGDLSFVYAINADGTLKWKYEISGGRPVRSSPAVDVDGTVYVATKISGTAEAELLALNPDGTLRWSYSVEQADIYCSPAVGENGLIYFGAENGIFYALNPDGTENWKYATNNGINWSSPAIDIDGTIYIGNVDGYLFAINSNSFGLVNSTWPKFRHDNRNTGRLSP